MHSGDTRGKLAVECALAGRYRASDLAVRDPLVGEVDCR